MPEIAFQLSSLKPLLQTPQGVLDCFRKLAAMGYRTLQIQWIDPSVPDEFVRDALAETGLACVSTQDFTQVVADNLDRFMRANVLWSSKLLCVSGMPAGLDFDTFLPRLKQLNTLAKAQGLTLTFHPRAQEYPILDRLLEEIPDMQLTLDCYHTHKAGLNPIDYLRRYAGRCDMVHFKDSVLTGQGDTLVPIGSGQHDWAPIWAACRETGVRWVFVEQETWQGDPFECMASSLEHLRSLQPFDRN